MNVKRLLLAILAAFVAAWLASFLVHGLWMRPVYKETMSLWRPEAEMQARSGWLFGGLFVYAATFVIVWAMGFAARGTVRCGAAFGVVMALFSQSLTLIMFAVQPLTHEIVWKWLIGGVLQGVAVGVVTALVYRPPAAPGG